LKKLAGVQPFPLGTDPDGNAAALVPTVPEIRYLIAGLLLRPPHHVIFIMAWSFWRRRRQAAAGQFHCKGRQNPQL
jgi:hypothetical protein